MQVFGLTSGQDPVNRQNYTTASIAPTADRLVQAWVTSSGSGSDPGVPTLTGAGMTWVQVATSTTGTYRVTLFRAMKTSPGSGAITIAHGGTVVRCSWSIFEVSEVKTTGSDGADAVVASYSGNGSSQNPSIPLSAPASADNRAFSGFTNNGAALVTPRTNWTEIHDVPITTESGGVETQWRDDSFETTASATFSASQIWAGIAVEVAAPVVHELSGTLQGVATFEAPLTRTRELTAAFQGIARWAKARLVKVPQGAPDNFVEPEIDFTVFDGYLEGGDGVVHSLIYHEDGETKGTTSALPTQAEKQDVGTNPLEQRPEFGDFFAQGDFSNGANQLYFHHVGRDSKKFLASEGYDINEEGSLTHLHEIAEAVDSTSIGAVTQANGVILVAQGSDVRVGNGLFPGTWGTEDPEAAGTPTTVADLASRGDEVFAALGAEGIHIRSSAGTWTHFQPDGSTDLVAGTVTRVAWLKDRLFVVGTAGREIFEVVADSTPTAIKTLPEGWTFESIFEAGAFVYAPAVNVDAGLSRVHIFGLNSTATAIEDKGSVQVPRGELFYSGIGYVGQVFLGGGKANDDGGFDPILYQAVQDDTGFLNLARIARGVGGGSNCSILSFEALGDSIVFGWSQAAAALTGERAGIAMYHLGRQAFSQHLKKDAVSSAQVQDILFYEGRLILSIKADGLYYEDTASFVADAFLISSVADWGGAGLKIWDRVEVSHGTLVADTTVTVQYTTEDPTEEEWFSTIISETDGATGASSKLSNVASRTFAVKLMSTANAGGTAAPLIQSFSIRSNLTRAQPEFTMTRFVRILAKDRKDGKATVVYKDPVDERIALMLLLDSWVTVWEPGLIWNAFIKSVSDTEPAEPFLSGTQGEPLKEAYLIRLDMIATGEAA